MVGNCPGLIRRLGGIRPTGERSTACWWSAGAAVLWTSARCSPSRLCHVPGIPRRGRCGGPAAPLLHAPLIVTEGLASVIDVTPR